jgi:ABC-type spermidine/putrescine transport system permease subunit II
MKRSKALTAVAIAILLFLLAPLMGVVIKGLSRQAFADLFSKPEILSAAIDSFALAAASALIATVLGTMTAFALPSLSPRMRKFVARGLIFPMILPEIALGLSFMVWFIKWGIPLGWGTLLSAHCAFCLSYATLIMKARVETLDWSLVDAGRDLGAQKLSLFRHAIYPQLVPALIASLVTCFALSLDDFLVSTFVKGMDQKLLPITIYSMMRLRVGQEIYSLSLLLFCFSVLIVLVTQLWMRVRSKADLMRLS